MFTTCAPVDLFFSLILSSLAPNIAPVQLDMRGRWFIPDWPLIESFAAISDPFRSDQTRCILEEVVRQRATLPMTDSPDFNCPLEGHINDVMKAVTAHDPVLRLCMGGAPVS